MGSSSRGVGLVCGMKRGIFPGQVIEKYVVSGRNVSVANWKMVTEVFDAIMAE